MYLNPNLIQTIECKGGETATLIMAGNKSSVTLVGFAADHVANAIGCLFDDSQLAMTAQGDEELSRRGL